MDRVRFGRALGYGARHAAKTLTQAIDAAGAPSPSHKPAASAPKPSATAPPAPAVPLQQRTAEAVARLQTARHQAKQARGSFLKPVKRFSNIVWLQVSGTFFALVAATMALGAWRDRAAFHLAGSHAAIKVYVFLAVFALFTYFAISSFIRAARR